MQFIKRQSCYKSDIFRKGIVLEIFRTYQTKAHNRIKVKHNLAPRTYLAINRHLQGESSTMLETCKVVQTYI